MRVKSQKHSFGIAWRAKNLMIQYDFYDFYNAGN